MSANPYERAFDEGRRARLIGKDLSANPYADGSSWRRKWYEGWCETNLRLDLAFQR